MEILEKDVVSKVHGTFKFADDLKFKDMLYGKILWSKYAHAKIDQIDVSGAEKIAGVKAVLTHKDVPGSKLFGVHYSDQPVLADERVRFLGDRIAVVFAETPEIAQKACREIKVDYTELSPILNPFDALAPNSQLIHDMGNLLKSVTINYGNVDENFGNAAVIVEEDYFMPFMEHGYLEPEAGVGVPDDDGCITIWYPTQFPYHCRKQIAECINLSEEKIFIKSTSAGGAFGGKTDVTIEIFLALGARITGQPVKITLTRTESLRTSTKRHAFYMHYKTAANKDGSLAAIEANLIADAGAYASHSGGVIEQAMVFGAGPYVWPACSIEGKAVYTNNMMGGAFRGYGINQVQYAVENQIDMMARELKLDPIEFRLKNALDIGQQTITGEKLISSVSVKETLIKAQEKIRELQLPKASKGKKYGIGIASAYKNVGFGRGYVNHGGAIIQLDSSGRVILKASALDLGQGVKTALAQILAKSTGVDYDIIDVIVGDTAQIPLGAAAVGQRQTYICGNAIIKAAEVFKKKLLTFVSGEYDYPRSDLAIDKNLIKNSISNENIVSFEELAKIDDFRVKEEYFALPTAPLKGDKAPVASSGNYNIYAELNEEDGHYRNYPTYDYATTVALVEIDEKSYDLKILKLVVIQDVGKAINASIVNRQIVGGAVMGMGHAVSEEFMHNGKNFSSTLIECGIPTICDIPEEIETIIVENPDPHGPFGAKGASEISTVPIPAALTNAIYDAIGFRITKLPIKKSLKNVN